MAHIEASQEAVFTPTVVAPARPQADQGRRRRRATLIGIAIVAVVTVVLGGLLYGRLQDSATTEVPEIVTGVSVDRPTYEIYQPGGSAYDGQVPAQARAADRSESAPGGSIYEQQVP